MLEFEISETEAGDMLRRYLQDKVQLSLRFIKRLTRQKGYLMINGEHVTVRYIVQTGDILQIRLPEEKRSNSVLAEKIPLHILYEDEWLIVLQKEAGIPSIPSRNYPSGTVANGLLAHYDAQQLPYTIHIVTRLDKDTSGLMLIAKHQLSHSLLSRMQKQNKINRHYEAIVEGVVEEEAYTINKRIRRKPSSIIEREVASDGKEAITHFRVVKRYDTYTHVAVRLETGRTHQIRVHFADYGHPLLGDNLYGNSVDQMSRQALHCTKLQFNHPYTDEKLTFQSNPPEQWNEFLTL